MKTNFLIATLLIFALSIINAQTPKAIPGQYIVVLKESFAQPVIKLQKNDKAATDRTAKQKANNTARESALSKVKEVVAKNNLKTSSILAEYADVTVGFAAKLSEQEFRILKANSNVAGVYQDYEVSVDSENILEPTCEEELAAQSTQVTDCAITKAGGSVSGVGKATWIWILDTGIDTDHPDLNVMTNTYYAKSFIAGETFEDGHGHGTHVAGIAAAKNNAFGVVGVSAGATVVPVKVLSNAGTGPWSGILSGLNHVASWDIPGDVVNMSLGGYGFTNCENSNPTIRDAIRALGNAGTYVVMAAGNDGANASLNFPGCINGNRVYTVANIRCDNTCYSGSNFGNPPVDWVAVGTSVYSTYKDGGYITMTGTSMSSPVVAGIIHARNGAPISGGTVTCGGVVYNIARR